jgi:hypothetical protein
MTKLIAKRKKRPGRTDPAEFKRFIDAARKRGADETLEEFAGRFLKIVPPKRRAKRTALASSAWIIALASAAKFFAKLPFVLLEMSK